MKKFSLAILTVALILVTCACNTTPSSPFAQSYFLADSRTEGVSTVNETLQYDVEFKPTENANGIAFSVDSQSSGYKTTLKNTTYNDVACYLLTTELNIVGEFTVGEEKTPITDNIVTECYFLGIDKHLAPLYSKRSVKAYSPLYSREKYEINYFEYEIVTEYDGNSAKTTFTQGENNKGSFDIEDGQVREYQNISNKSYYIDNELLLFAPRAMNLGSASTSFYTIDALSSVNRKMVLSPDAVPSETISKNNLFYLNSKAVSSVKVFNTTISIDSQYSGNALKATYIANTEQNARCAMLTFTQSAFYELGDLQCNLKIANNN